MKSIYFSHIFRIVSKTVMFILLVACHSASFENVNLQPIMIQPEDLPAVLIAGENAPLESDDYFNYDVAHQQTIMTLDGETIGGVRVYLFHNPEDRDRMYDILSLMETPEGITPFQTPPIGDSIAARQGKTQSGETLINLTFKRCYAVAHIWLRTGDDFNQQGNDIVTYSENLDARLQTVACP